MRTIIKLAIAALILNATYHLGVAYWEHYEFEDSVQKLIQFSEKATPQELTKGVMMLAEERGLPLEQGDVYVVRQQRQVTIDAAYSRSVNLFPRYSREFDFTLHTTALMLN